MLMRQTFLYLPVHILGPAAQLAAAFIWTFWLTPSELGGYALIWSIQELAGLLGLTWWSAFVQRYASSIDSHEAKRRFDALEALVQIGSAILQIALAALAMVFLFPGVASWSLFAAIGTFTLVRNLGAHLAVRARAQSEVLAYATNILIGSVGGLALGVMAMVFLGPSLEALLWAYTVAQVVALILSWPLMRAPLRTPSFDRELLSQAWAFGGPVALSSSLVWIGTHSIRFVVEAWSGRAAVGLLSVGWWLGLRLASFAGMAVMGAAYNVAVERMRNEGPEAARAQLSTISAVLIGLLAPLCVGGAMLSDSIATHLVHSDYTAMTSAILPAALIAGSLRMFQDQCVDAGFLVFERPNYPPLVSAMDALTAVLGCLVGLVIGGVPGAAWGCAAGAGITSLGGVIMARKVYGFRIRSEDIAKIGGATALMALALAAFGVPETFSALILATVAGALTYAAVMILLFPQFRGALRRTGRNDDTAAG